MMTEDLTDCPNCKYKKALTHYSSAGEINWIACPKCRKYFEWGKEVQYIDQPFIQQKEEEEIKFWKNVEKDTGYKSEDQ